MKNFDLKSVCVSVWVCVYVHVQSYDALALCNMFLPTFPPVWKSVSVKKQTKTTTKSSIKARWSAAHLFYFGCHLQHNEHRVALPHAHPPCTVPLSPPPPPPPPSVPPPCQSERHAHAPWGWHRARFHCMWNNGIICACVCVVLHAKRPSPLAANCLCTLQEKKRAEGERMSALAVVFLAMKHNESKPFADSPSSRSSPWVRICHVWCVCERVCVCHPPQPPTTTFPYKVCVHTCDVCCAGYIEVVVSLHRWWECFFLFFLFEIYLFIYFWGGEGGMRKWGGEGGRGKGKRRAVARRAASLMLPCHGHAGSSNWPPYWGVLRCCGVGKLPAGPVRWYSIQLIALAPLLLSPLLHWHVCFFFFPLSPSTPSPPPPPAPIVSPSSADPTHKLPW